MNKKNCEENRTMDRRENKRTAIQSVLRALNRAKSYKWGHTTYLRIPVTHAELCLKNREG